MSKRQTLTMVLISSIFTLMIMASSILFFSWVTAAPPVAPVNAMESLQATDGLLYTSVSALAFIPLNQNAFYAKDPRRQLLTLGNQARIATSDDNIFVAPLTLPDKSRLMGLTVFGEDFDNQGAVILRLKRCDHGQALCLNIAETTSTDVYAAGQFETSKVTTLNEIMDNNFYTYLLELELTAIANSGLRSVRLEFMTGEGATSPPGRVEKWSLSGQVRNFLLPNTNLVEVRVCTDDLSHLNNPTHYPFVVVDNRIVSLSSNSCVTVQGRNLEIRRELNTGPSSGTYQFLR